MSPLILQRTKADIPESTLWADSVEKVLSCEEPIFFRGAGALMEKLCEGPHVSADFLPAHFVAQLRGILLPNAGCDGSTANFCCNATFEFFNKIGQNQTFPLLPPSPISYDALSA